MGWLVVPGHYSPTVLLSVFVSVIAPPPIYRDQLVPVTAACPATPSHVKSQSHTKEPGIRGSFVTFSGDVMDFL